MNVSRLFEDELRRRGFAFSIDPESARHILELGGGRMLISLSNLERDFAVDEDSGRISRFVDAIVASSRISDTGLSTDQLYWALEPSDYAEAPDFRSALSDRVDRVLVHLSADSQLITWVTPQMLHNLGLSEADAAAKGLANLAGALKEATVQAQEIDGVQVGFIGTRLPFKAALILAPNLQEVVGARLGWPLMAVIPDRDFLYLWAARHKDFVQRVGGVVVREFSRASYPISTEMYEITEQAIRAIGEFPTGAEPDAPPNRGPAAASGGSGVSAGPPSVS